MQSRKLGLGLSAVAVAVAVALFFVLREDGSDDGETTATTAVAEQADEEQTGGAGESRPQKPEPKPEPEVAEIVVRGGEPVGGVAELEFDRGERIRFVVRSDVSDHVHLHGYDVFKDVAAGGKAEFDVPATIDGLFEVELEDRVVPLAEITVNPG